MGPPTRGPARSAWTTNSVAADRVANSATAPIPQTKMPYLVMSKRRGRWGR
jgi:hypothetical protein